MRRDERPTKARASGKKSYDRKGTTGCFTNFDNILKPCL